MTALAWFIVMIVCGAVEIVTGGFWLLCFAVSGAIVALGVHLGILDHIEIQLLVFALLTLILIMFARPLVVKLTSSGERASNTNALIGQQGIAITDLRPLEFGQVKVKGEIWTAIADEVIALDQAVEIVAIDGVKLVVVAIKEDLNDKLEKE